MALPTATRVIGLVLLVALLAACQPEVPAPSAGATPQTGPEVVRIAPEFDARLGTAYEDLSKGDESTLAGMLQQPGAALLTTDGSANDRFWTHLVAQGWGVPVEVDPQLVQAMPTARSYGFAPGGERILTAWLARYLERRDG